MQLTQRDFAELVQMMRTAQRRYFRDRDNLDECKRLERTVDEEVLLQLQPTLFDERRNPRDN